MRSILVSRVPRWLAAGLVVSGTWVVVGCAEEAPSTAPSAASTPSAGPADGASDASPTAKTAGGGGKTDIMPEIPKKARTP